MMPSYGFPRRKFVVQAGNENRPTPVNWRRGLFRVWVLLSTAWLMGWSLYLIIFGLQGGIRTLGQVLSVPVLLFGPPVALLLFGIATRWALHGFRTDAGPPPQG
jgi:hypothetical protein